jgi:Divergent InlB B-repeat domain/PQQ-like domain
MVDTDPYMVSKGGRRVGRLCLLAAATAIFLALFISSAAAAPITGMADAMRTGWFPDEPGLTPQLVEADFGQTFDTEIEGQVYAQPLVVGNTVFVATEDNWIYGIDKRTGAVEWERDLGEPWDPMDIGCEDLLPSIGITGTPVVDPEAGIAYFTSKTYASGTSGPAVWKMHAVDVTNGDEEPGFPVEIGGEAENLAGVPFNPTDQLQRTGLLLMNGVVYAGFGSHCDFLPYQGWIAGVSTSGEKKTMWASWKEGGGVWQGGGGLASDGEGQILFATGNSFEPAPLSPTPTPPEDLGDSVVRLQVEPSGAAEATDFFAPFDREELDKNDRDLGSGGVIALPSQYFGTEAVPNLLVETGKEKTVYVLDRDHLGGFAQGPEEKDDVVQELTIAKGSFGSTAIWPGDGGYLYIPSNGTMAVLKYSEVLGQPQFEYVAAPAEHGNFGSGSPIVTSEGTASGSGIVWIVNRCTATPGCQSTLRAYPAVPTSATPQPLWSTEIGIADKFNHPVADEGNVYVGTEGHLLAFGALHHTLTVTPPGSGGTVTSNIGGIECGSTCSHSYETGAAVTLSATPSNGYTFSGWSGGGCTGIGSCQVTMGRDLTVSASFAPNPPPLHTLTITPPGTGGTVISDVGGIDCGSTCAQSYEAGTVVILTGTPNSGYSFDGWSGAGCSGAGNCQVTMDQDETVAAVFTQTSPSLHTLTVIPPGTAGTVASNVGGIDCGSTCLQLYADGTTVTLSATPSNGYTFSGWSGGGCSGSGSCQVTMDQDLTVGTTFTPNPPSPGGGSSNNPPPGQASPPTGTKVAGAKVSSKNRTARFTFKATGATGFQCRLIKAGKKKPAFSRCTSPKKYRNLKPGSYVFEVRSFNAAGTDPRPAKKRFKI